MTKVVYKAFDILDNQEDMDNLVIEMQLRGYSLFGRLNNKIYFEKMVLEGEKSTGALHNYSGKSISMFMLGG